MTSLIHDLDRTELRRTFACFPSGIAAVCGFAPTGPVGLAASSFTPVSLSPPLVSICIQKTSQTWPMLSALPRLGISILADEQSQTAISLASKKGDRFTGVDWHTTGTGAVLIDEAVAWFDCTLHTQFDAGDHTIAVLQVHLMSSDPTAEPLVFHRSQFRNLERK